MGEVEFVRQERQQALGMKLGKADAVGSCAVGPDKQCEKVFVDLDGQIAQALLVRGQKARPTSQLPTERAAAHADVDAVVGQAHVRQAGQHDQVVGDDAGLAQLGDGIQLAAAQHLVAQVHVLIFLFAVAPSRKARAHEQLAIKRVGGARRKLFLVYRGHRRVIDQRPLPAFQQTELPVRPRNQQ